MVVFNVQSYSEESQNFAGKVVFLGDPMERPPPAPTGGKYLGHLRVKFIKITFERKSDIMVKWACNNEIKKIS